MMERVDEFGLSVANSRTENADNMICCTHSSDELTDFFASNGVGDCQDIVCKFIGIECADDLKLITAADVQGSRFSRWAEGSLTMVQYKKIIRAFSSSAEA